MDCLDDLSIITSKLCPFEGKTIIPPCENVFRGQLPMLGHDTTRIVEKLDLPDWTDVRADHTRFRILTASQFFYRTVLCQLKD